MEQLLLKLARQLDSLDEASLMALWEKYAAIVNHFEPSQRWQEAVLVLSFIQAKRWKNQLFNAHWAARTRGVNLSTMDDDLKNEMQTGLPPQPAFNLDYPDSEKKQNGQRAKVLPFKPITTE